MNELEAYWWSVCIESIHTGCDKHTACNNATVAVEKFKEEQKRGLFKEDTKKA